MTLQFYLSPKDLTVFGLYTENRKQRKIWRDLKNLVIWLLFIGFLFFYLYANEFFLRERDKIWIFMACFGLYFVIYRIASRYVRIISLSGNKENRTLWKRYEVSFSENRVEIKTDSSNCSYAWSQFINWIERGEHFFLYQSASTGLIIPKRDMDAGQVDALRKLLEDHSKNKN